MPKKQSLEDRLRGLRKLFGGDIIVQLAVAEDKIILGRVISEEMQKYEMAVFGPEEDPEKPTESLNRENLTQQDFRGRYIG